jgi:hypothetical protein
VEGVPEITQVLDRERPDGSVGLVAQPVMVPPELVGVCDVIANPTLKVKGDPL